MLKREHYSGVGIKYAKISLTRACHITEVFKLLVKKYYGHVQGEP